MLKIALTGNIASGKSEVEKILKQKGFVVLCLDKVTHDIYENDEEFRQELIKNFNTHARNEISKIVFSNKEKLKKLEHIIYPKIKSKMEEFIFKNSDKKCVIVSAAMLFESEFDKYFDKIIFVSAKEDIRLKRLMKRNKLNKNEAKKRISAQSEEEEKIKKSDFIIYNNSDTDVLKKNCNQIIKDINTLL